jgi:hypothetical protein
MVGKPYGESSLGRRMWVDNIKMNLRGIGWGSINWTYLTEYRYQRRAVLNKITILPGKLKVGKFFSICYL